MQSVCFKAATDVSHERKKRRLNEEEEDEDEDEEVADIEEFRLCVQVGPYVQGSLQKACTFAQFRLCAQVGPSFNSPTEVLRKRGLFF